MSNKIIKFSASWCNPCKTLAKTLEGVDFGIPLVEIDIDDQMDVANRYNIRGVPTLVLVDEFEDEITRLVGLHSIETIKQKFNL